jgi:hypothetical protein
LHYYDSLLVVEKRPIEKPFHLKTGTSTIPDLNPAMSLWRRIDGQMKRAIDRLIG